MVTDGEGLLCFIKRIKLDKCGHWKRRPGSLLPHRRRTTRKKPRDRRQYVGWIDNIKHWTNGGLEVAGEIARRREQPN